MGSLLLMGAGPSGAGGPVAPTATTGSGTNLAATTATVGGDVNPNGAATNYYFEYGLTTGYGSTTTSTSAGSGSSSVPVTANLVGLDPSTTYHFRLVAINAGGTTNGSDATFVTGPLVPVATAHYKFDEDGGPYTDDAAGAHTLTGINTPTSATGLLGNAMVTVHATDNYAKCSTDAGLKVFGSGFTASIWFKPSALNVNGEIWSNINGNSGVYFGIIGDGSGGIRLTLNNFSTGYYAGGSGLFVLDTWAHWCIVYDPTLSGMNRLKIYKNGIDVSGSVPSDAGTPPASLSSSTNDLQVGTGAHGAVSGALDEFWLTAAAYTAAQVKISFGDGAPPAYPATQFDSHVTIILDDFTGTNGTLLTAHTPTPTNTLSLSWVEQTGSGSGKLGHIQSNDLVCDVGGICTLDTGSTDNTVTVYGRIGNGEQVYQAIAVLIRVQDYDHYLWFHIKYDGSVILLKRLSGTPDDYAVVPGMTYLTPPSWGVNNYNDYYWTIKDIGGKIRLYQNGTLFGYSIEPITTYSGNTKVGLGQALDGSQSLGAVIKKIEVRTGDQLPSYPYPGFTI